MTTSSQQWATYLRVSSEDKQTPERSFAMQRQRIQENLLASSAYPFYREYRDMLTGTTPNRADYKQMLADAQAGQFSHLGLYRADRFGRDTVEGLQAATQLMSMGVKIRVAHMPSLQPETPDGFFMFVLQMGLAQREVDVLRQRTLDGMEAKLRAGGWAHKAPEGYVNQEKQVSSGKYQRWVEPDPVLSKGLRMAWDMLLTGRYTLDQICEELNSQGYVRRSGRPWAWTNPKTGQRKYARSRLHAVFNNPFYAGWITSERFGIAVGEVRGKWEPLVTHEEYQRGIEILRQHGDNKSRHKRHFYLLRNLLHMRVDGRLYKMHGSTPTGRELSYSYYITRAKPRGKQIHIPCDDIDAQVFGWLNGIIIAPEHTDEIREVYERQIEQVTARDLEGKVAKHEKQLARLRQEETRLGRLFITGKITEEAYSRLRDEWKEKVHHVERQLANMEREMSSYVDDLDVALLLLSHLSELYERLESKRRASLLHILARRIIVGGDGEIIDHELHSPFAYLDELAKNSHQPQESGSTQVPLSTPTRTRTWASASGGPRSVL